MSSHPGRGLCTPNSLQKFPLGSGLPWGPNPTRAEAAAERDVQKATASDVGFAASEAQMRQPLGQALNNAASDMYQFS